MTIAATYAPPISSRSAWWIYQATITLAGSLLIALTAQIYIPLPFSPVPLTGQTLGVLLVGTVLGGMRGSLAVLTYLAEGASGLPVFAGGAMGVGVFFGPTAGYLLGFVPAAYLTGRLAEFGFDKRVWTMALAMLLGTLLILLLGASWLSWFVGGSNALQMGVFPFLPGDVIKISVAALALPALRKLV
jgi:biotin transport system substrate-specific component